MSDVAAPTEKLSLVWSDSLAAEARSQALLWAARAAYSHRLLELIGALHWREVRVVPVDESLAQFGALSAFHDPNYLFTLRALGEGQASLPAPAYGLDAGLNMPYRGLAANASQLVASAASAVRAACGPIPYAISIAASQPHARPAESISGHLLNDVVLAVRAARQKLERVALVSLEAEFLPAVQGALADAPHVLAAFLHEGTDFLYPHRSVPEGTVHAALPPGAGDEAYLSALDQVIAPILEAAQPAMILLLGGASAHPSEPLSHMRLTTQGYSQILRRLMDLAPRLVVLGGDSSLPTVSARFAAVAVATLADRVASLPPTLPALLAKAWGDSLLHDEPPRRLSREMAAYVGTRTEEAILLAQRAAFPRWNLPLPNGAAPLQPEPERQPLPRVAASALPADSERIQAIRDGRRSARRQQSHTGTPSPERPPPSSNTSKKSGRARPASRRNRRSKRP